MANTYSSSAVSNEIRSSVAQQGLGLYRGGPGVDFSKANTQFVVSVLLISPLTVVSADTDVLLITRNNGKKTNVSGFADIMTDPRGRIKDSLFDIIAYTAVNELREECGLTRKLSIRPGGRFVERAGAVIRHILTVGAIYTGSRPRLVPDGREVLSCDWVPLRNVRQEANLSSGYLRNTLPHSLMAYGLSLGQGRRLVG